MDNQNPETLEGTEKKEPIKDPVIYIEEFRKSKLYEQELSRFKAGKTFTEEYPGEMIEIFEDQENTRQCLIQFARDSGVLIYERSKYDNGEKDSPITEYLSLLKEYKMHPERYPDALAYDSMRGMYHNSATDFISKKFNISKHLSIGIVQILAISQGLESFGFATQDRTELLRRSLS